jgi:hypothetical protein
MSKASENAYKTAITRSKLSTAAQYLVDNDLLKGKCLDFGCGKGFDCDALGIDGYDPHYRPRHLEFDGYDTVMCNFVLNCLPEEEWFDVIKGIIGTLKLDGGIAYISVRNDKKNLNGFTMKDTFQTFVELDYPIVKKTSNFVMYKIEMEA